MNRCLKGFVTLAIAVATMIPSVALAESTPPATVVHSGSALGPATYTHSIVRVAKPGSITPSDMCYPTGGTFTTSGTLSRFNLFGYMLYSLTVNGTFHRTPTLTIDAYEGTWVTSTTSVGVSFSSPNSFWSSKQPTAGVVTGTGIFSGTIGTQWVGITYFSNQEAVSASTF